MSHFKTEQQLTPPVLDGQRFRDVVHLAESSVPPFSSKDVRLSGTTLERAKKIVAVLNETVLDVCVTVTEGVSGSKLSICREHLNGMVARRSRRPNPISTGKRRRQTAGGLKYVLP
jgi:hypothetical protein